MVVHKMIITRLCAVNPSNECQIVRKYEVLPLSISLKKLVRTDLFCKLSILLPIFNVVSKFTLTKTKERIKN